MQAARTARTVLKETVISTEARHEAILRELRTRGRVRSAQLARALEVSDPTIRRDLATLETRGLLRRTHGGAVPPTSNPHPDAPHTHLGMIVPLSSYYYEPVIRGAQAAAAHTNIRLHIAISDYSPSTERALVSRMIAGRVQGLLIATAVWNNPEPRTRTLLTTFPKPLVLIERDPHALFPPAHSIDTVRTDHHLGARIAIHHLHAKGHRTIAVLSPGHYATAHLHAGARQAAYELGLPHIRTVTTANWTPLTREPIAWPTIEQLLTEGTTAMLVHPEHDAVDLAQTALHHGLRIPDDLAIVAYDDEISDLCEIPLTAVAPNKHAVGYQAVTRAVQLLQNTPHLETPHTTLIHPQLRYREST